MITAFQPKVVRKPESVGSELDLQHIKVIMGTPPPSNTKDKSSRRHSCALLKSGAILNVQLHNLPKPILSTQPMESPQRQSPPERRKLPIIPPLHLPVKTRESAQLPTTTLIQKMVLPKWKTGNDILGKAPRVQNRGGIRLTNDVGNVGTILIGRPPVNSICSKR